MTNRIEETFERFLEANSFNLKPDFTNGQGLYFVPETPISDTANILENLTNMGVRLEERIPLFTQEQLRGSYGFNGFVDGYTGKRNVTVTQANLARETERNPFQSISTPELLAIETAYKNMIKKRKQGNRAHLTDVGDVLRAHQKELYKRQYKIGRSYSTK